MPAIGGHQKAYRGRTDDWLTPPEIIEELGEFDLDPCCPPDMPWETAKHMIHFPADGLDFDWSGRVWLNPPYGPETGKWLERLAYHGNGVALIFARTETDMFFRWGWQQADAMLFLKGRLHFHDVAGKRAKFNSGGPSVLIAYGHQNVESLQASALPGAFVNLKEGSRCP